MRNEGRVGPYRIIRLINEGGQGSVYLGYDTRLRRRIAIKIFRQPERFKARRALLREARMVAALDSPRIVSVHDIIESPDYLALAMEYVPGCDLRELLTHCRPSPGSIVAIATDISAALAISRQCHIVHGDLKPANVLITTRGRVKLTDFGIARPVLDTREVAGSLSALSPEQALGKPLDVRSDLFALGRILYTMLCGVEPFPAHGRLDPAMALQRPPRPVQELVPPEFMVPTALSELTMQLLQPDPADRPANTHRVRRILREVHRSMPLSSGSKLLREARPCFRKESSDDIPLNIPSGLGGQSRSRLRRRGIGQLLPMWSWPRRVLVGVVLLVGLSAPVMTFMLSREVLVYIDAPHMDITQSEDIPLEVSAPWLVEQVKLELRNRMGKLRVSGPIGATPITVLRVGEDTGRESPESRFKMNLHCWSGLCAFNIQRQSAGAVHHQQALLLPGMDSQQWAAIIRGATAKLYD